MSSNLLNIKNLNVEYKTDEGISHVLNNVTLSINKGETLGLVGETGAGKTTTALSIMRLLPKKTGYIKNGEIIFDENKNLLNLKEAEMRLIRGEKISMIFQDPMTSLNPVIKVGDQIRESLEIHRPDMTNTEMDKRVDEILEMVGIPSSRKNEYPHQFSGGMKQRVVIAIALSCEPELLIADEPTTALDVTIQAQVLHMMDNLKTKLNTSMILITHDLGIVSQTCEKVAVMYAGSIIEYGTAEEIFLGNSHHPYTTGLFGSIPDIKVSTSRLSPIEGLMPDPMDLPKGCIFHPRCPKCFDKCRTIEPDVIDINGEHKIKCHLYKKGKDHE
ncbi:ABC transporter ATP-binding protein [Sedimentibacter sp. MB31-C6]|uniref:ABC transporter ATP-binding protein n=1 Tax=Sedimentibacter sp. MB31-C6 TaxID=3109366 RepID=UPI002DDD9892|nr:ABC transporter ATP-binding protein [Sedimentibacter sp. MB36-C1]WSI05227.1 ABC transporter ATP-binding protein [Sedimentibacter sp. MB36-C1]